MDALWEWALKIDEGFAYRLYCLWEDCSTLEFLFVLNGLTERMSKDAEKLVGKVA